MDTGVEHARRAVAAVLSLVLVLLAAPAVASPVDLAALGAAVAVLLVAVAVLPGPDLRVLATVQSGDHGAGDDERHLRGAFRRQSSPDTPGRPRPRAPGTGPPPA